jgi:hypothetical protein
MLSDAHELILPLIYLFFVWLAKLHPLRLPVKSSAEVLKLAFRITGLSLASACGKRGVSGAFQPGPRPLR